MPHCFSDEFLAEMSRFFPVHGKESTMALAATGPELIFSPGLAHPYDCGRNQQPDENHPQALRAR